MAEDDLTKLISEMSPTVRAETFVFATLPVGVPLPECEVLMTFREAEGVTLIVEQSAALSARLAHDFPCRMITLNVHSALDAVGFLAAVTNRLAGLGMGVNPVSGYFHDHLFIPEDRAEEALAELKRMAAEA
ncbi:MAG: ACT domain-containing protein [Magnetovibrionaceae bacterium]